MVAEAPILLRPAEVAELLGCSRSKAYQLIQARRIPSLRIAGSVRVPRAALLAWIDQNTEGATATNGDAPELDREFTTTAHRRAS